MTIEKDKVFCQCGHRMRLSDLLTAKNPFDESEVIYGCPRCKSVDSTELACDEPGCWRSVSCGCPDKDGVYRRTCSAHSPMFRRDS